MDEQPPAVMLGPYWQYECPRCREMSDVYDTPAERDEAARRHRCHPCPHCGRTVIEDA